MKKSILAIALSSLLFLACTTVSAPEPVLDGEPTGKVALETYVMGDLKFDYPVDWTVEERIWQLEEPKKWKIDVSSPERTSAVAAAGVITPMPCDVCIYWSEQSLEEWLEINRELVGELELSDIEFNGMQAHMIFSGVANNDVVLIENGGKVYSFAMTKDELTDQALSQTVMGSVRFE